MKHSNDILNKRVDYLKLSVRSRECLESEGIIYIGDLVQKSESEMLKIPNLGRKSFNELKEFLAFMDLGFGTNLRGIDFHEIVEDKKTIHINLSKVRYVIVYDESQRYFFSDDDYIDLPVGMHVGSDMSRFSVPKGWAFE